jgi:EAL domain-containing protein (putative c-di-GMP-specific phosphodiesterase class I)
MWFPASSAREVDDALKSMRAHLGMDVAFVSEFIGEQRVIRHVDSNASRGPLHAGQVIPLDQGYCQKVVDGRLPELIPDTARVPDAMAIPETRAIPIGSHLSVPLRLANGQVYGTFCCFSFEPDPTLGLRDLRTMRAFAATLAQQLDEDLANNRIREEKTQRIKAILASPEPAMVFQPIFRLSDMRLNGAEALARFGGEPRRSPDRWFAEAAEIGALVELEAKAIANALAAFRPVWARRPLHLGLNASPMTIGDGGLAKALGDAPLRLVVLEITEHERIDDYDSLNRALRPLRDAGLRVAIDDAGSGYSSMRHILNVEPDIIKLDISLTRGIDAQSKRRAMAGALIAFARQTDCRIVAEGVETEAELTTLRELGVDAAQGYHLGKPANLERYLDLMTS